MGCMAPDQDWTEREAKRERVSVRVCVNCRRDATEIPPNKSLYSIETNEKLCGECLEALREHTRTVHLDVWSDGQLTEEEKELVRQSFRYLRGLLDRPAEVVAREGQSPFPVGLDLGPVDVEEESGEATPTPAVEP